MPVEMTMDLEEYFGQGDLYFSESQQEMVPLEGMVYPHLLYAFKKLIREWGAQFVGSPLFHSFFAITCPNKERITELLKLGISVAYWLDAPGAKTKRQVRGVGVIVSNKLGVILKFENKADLLTMTPEEIPDIGFKSK
jgi:hypothetical protein